MTRFDRFMFAVSRRGAAAGAAIVAAISGQAHATWSILIADTRTGEIVIGSATCVETIDLQQSTPVLISGVGAVTAQSVVDISGTNRQMIRDRLLQGVPLDAILDELAMRDGGHDNRQYGFITADGQTLTYSGVQNAEWAGGQTGRIQRGAPGFADDIVYSVQGNILSGGNVVQAAIDAIRASDGDLPAMMMAGMQAAKSAGGDGRCSCNNANPTGCGSPPPEPFKSAHVGYMLGTRAGDIDAARAVYPTDGLVGAIETMDLDGDGYEEVIVGNRDTNEISIFRNTSSDGVPLSSLELMGTINAPASGAVAMSMYLQKNGSEQRLSAVFNTPSRAVEFRASATGTLEVVDTLNLEGNVQDFAAGDNGPVFQAISTQNPNQILYYRDWDTHVPPSGDDEIPSMDLDFAPAGIALKNIVGFNSVDLLVTDPANNLVHIYEGQEIGFGTHTEIPTSNDPVQVTATDMDGDGDNEIVVLCGSGRRAEVYTLDSDQWTLWGSATLFGNGIGLAVGDMSGDGLPDIVTTYAGNNRNLQLFINDGVGGLTQQTRTRVGSGARSLRLNDMNNNGDLDIVIGNGGSDGVIVLDNAQGIDLPQPGRFAAGQYFMSFNIPNQRADDPDPVDQLQSLYDAWLLQRAGKVDAVKSSVFGRGLIEPNGSSTLRIELRDLDGELLDISDTGELELSIGDPIGMLGAPTLVEPGVFEVEVAAGEELARTELTVRAGPQGERVELMPGLAISVVESLADFNADGVCNFFDVVLFIEAWYSQEADADLVTPFVWDFNDVAAFLQAYNACTGG